MQKELGSVVRRRVRVGWKRVVEAGLGSGRVGREGVLLQVDGY